MSISSVTSKIIYVGDGTTQVFAYPFRILADGDLTVTRFYEATLSTSVLVLNTDYEVSGAGEAAGGNVTLTGSYTNLPSGSKLVITREMGLKQEVDYVENDPFPAETLENALDRLTMITQQLKEVMDRSITRDITQEEQWTFPEPVGDKVIAWNTSATGLTNVTNTVVLASSSATAAASSATVAVDEAAVAVSSATVSVSASAAAVRHDGTQPLTANWDVGTYNITSVKTFGATTVTASSINVSGTASFGTIAGILESPTLLTAAASVLDTLNYIQVKIGATTYKLARIV